MHTLQEQIRQIEKEVLYFIVKPFDRFSSYVSDTDVLLIIKSEVHESTQKEQDP